MFGVAPEERKVWGARFACFEQKNGHPVRVDLRTRNLEDVIFELAVSKGMTCPLCGRLMKCQEQWVEREL